MVVILGVKIDTKKRSEVFHALHEFLSSTKQHIVVTPNPEMLVEAQNDSIFRAALNGADLAVADGTGLLLASRFLGKEIIPQRITGNDILDMLFQIATKERLSVYFLGGAGKQAVIAAEKVKEKYPLLTIHANAGGPIWYENGWHASASIFEDIKLKKPPRFIGVVY